MINTSVNRTIYKGNGVATEFAIPFPVLQKEDVKVVKVNADQTESTLEKDYFVDLDKMAVFYPGYPVGEEPAESERPAILASGEKLVIYRDIEINQLSSLGEKWPFAVIEKALDKLTMICQDLFNTGKRTLKLPESAGNNISFDLPAPVPNTIFGWNADGTALETVKQPQYYSDLAAKYADAAKNAENASRENLSEISRIKDEALEIKDQAETINEKIEGNLETANQLMDQTEGYANQAKEASATALASKADPWDEGKIYHYPDVVAYKDGHTYRCVDTTEAGEAPGSSNKWVQLTVDLSSNLFDLDDNGDFMPSVEVIGGRDWQIDGNGDLMPKAYDT